jgi:4-hydroxy-tetrahydrodipicolinate synthase
MTWPQVFTAMITPFNEDDSLDLETAGRLAAYLVEHGSDGLMVAGTTGESPALTDDERRSLFEAVRSHVPSHIPIWIGTGCNEFQQTVDWTRQAESLGADGVLIVTPYYNKPPQYALVEHFSQVAATTALPIMLYNVPSRTGVNMEPDTVGQIMERASNIRAIKEASGNISQMAHLMNRISPDAIVYSGDDAMFYPALALGAHGVVSVASHVVGDQVAALSRAWKNGEVDRAMALHRSLLPLFEELFRVTNPIPIKWALAQLGWPVGRVRLPLAMPPDTQVFARLAELLAQQLSLNGGTMRVG